MKDNLKINDMPQNERPMEKLLLNGPESLSNAELLAILLRTGTKSENVISLSNRVLSEVNGLDGLLNVSYSDITKIKGIKDTKACQIFSLIELCNRFRTLKAQRNSFSITNPQKIGELLLNEMRNLTQETLKLIMLDTKNNIISTKDIFKGTLNSSIVHPREIFSEAVKKSSASIIICHNHPSGDPTPSKEDINITIRLNECGRLMGIQLLDHIIIGSNSFISLKQKGII